MQGPVARFRPAGFADGFDCLIRSNHGESLGV
jgi:hypothetical protein